MRRYTKAQIQIGETIAVIIIFVMLLTFSLLWYTYSQDSKQSKARAEQLRSESVEVTKIMMNLPEITCSVAGSKEHSCIDLYRLYALSDEINGDYRDSYSEMFAGGRLARYAVRINLLYPVPELFGLPSTIDVFSYIPDGTENTITTRVPVVVLDPVREYRFFGVMLITQGEVG